MSTQGILRHEGLPEVRAELSSLQGKICSGTYQWCSIGDGVVAATKVVLRKADEAMFTSR
jgi:hypothetical protein